MKSIEQEYSKLKEMRATDVRDIRESLEMSQAEFAARFGINLGTLRNWEHGRRVPDIATKTYLHVISQNAGLVEKALGPDIFDSEAYRLLYGSNRQKELAEEILRYYSKYALFKEKYPENLNSKEVMRLWGEDLWDTYHDFRNNLLDFICIRARILFCEYKGDSHYQRLIGTNEKLTSEILLAIKQELHSEGSAEKEKERLTESLLKLAGLSFDEFTKTKEEVKKYVDKRCAHAEDYSPKKAKEDETRLIFPRVLPIAKLAYGLYRIILSVKRIEGEDYGINISINSGKSFDELISYYQASFKRGWPKLLELLI